MEFDMSLNWLAIVLAAVSNVVIGFIWYSPKVLGKPWMKAHGFPEDMETDKGQMMKGMSLMVLGAFSMSFVFYSVTFAFVPDSWYHDGDVLTFGMATTGAFFMWIGFAMPLIYSKVSWEGKGNMLLVVDGGYYLVALFVQAMVFLGLAA